MARLSRVEGLMEMQQHAMEAWGVGVEAQLFDVQEQAERLVRHLSRLLVAERRKARVEAAASGRPVPWYAQPALFNRGA